MATVRPLIPALLAMAIASAAGDSVAAEPPASAQPGSSATPAVPETGPQGAEPPTAAAPPPPTLDTGAGGASCTVPASADNPSVSLLIIGLRWSGWTSECEELVRYLAPGKAPATAEMGRNTERLLIGTGYFKAARCEPADGGGRLSCLLAPADIVRGVSIGGKLPFTLLEQEVRQRVFLRPGVLLGDEGPSLTLQGRRLTDYLVDEGYFDSHVTMRTRPISGAEPNRGVEVRAIVTAGQSAKLRDVWVDGDQVIRVATLASELRHSGFLFLGTRRFQPAQFRLDVARIAALHQSRGWPEARVDGDYYLDRKAGAVDVMLRISTGPKLDLRFVGNRELHADELADVATFKQAGIIDEVEMDNTAAAITQAYQKEGFYEPKVTYSAESAPKVHRVTYTIVEGPRSEVTEVSFVGNLSFTPAELRDGATMVTAETGLFYAARWVDAYVARDVLALEAFYRDAGFAGVEVEATRQMRPDGRLRAVFTIREGPRRRVASLSFEGLPAGVATTRMTRSLKLLEGAPFSPSRLDDDRRAVLAELGAAGYTHGEAAQRVFQLGGGGSGNVSIHYLVNPGERAYFRGLLVRGNFRTSRSLIDHSLGLSAGDPLDLVAVGRARRRLRDLGIFTSVEVRPLGEWRGAAETWLMAGVQERSARSANAVLAFATDELFSVGADYLDTNLFGHAVRLDSQLRLSNASEVVGSHCGGPVERLGATGINLGCGRIGNRDLAQLMLRAPRPLELPADLESTAIYDYQDKPVYRERRLGVTAGLVRTFGTLPSVTTALGYELVSAYFKPRVESAKPPPGLPTATIGRIVPRAGLDRRDSIADPHSGFRLDLRLELAHHALALGLPTDATFLRAIGSGSAYVTLGRLGSVRLKGGEVLGGPVVVALATTVGAAKPWAGGVVPDSETFYYGGDQSVRGLPDRASAVPFPRARYLVTGTTELRWYLWQGLGIGSVQIAALADAGTAAYASANLGKDVTLTVGGALRYVTPVGPISLAYAKPVVWPGRGACGLENAPPEETCIPTGGRLHFSFGYTF